MHAIPEHCKGIPLPSQNNDMSSTRTATGFSCSYQVQKKHWQQAASATENPQSQNNYFCSFSSNSFARALISGSSLAFATRCSAGSAKRLNFPIDAIAA